MTETGANPGPQEEEAEADNRSPFRAKKIYFFRGGSGSAEPPAKSEVATEVVAGPYADLVKELLEAENAIVSGLETRGVAVVSTSGALVTLLLGLAGLATRVHSLRVSSSVLILASLAVVFFLLAGLVAMWINSPRKTSRPEARLLGDELWKRWNLPHPYDPLKKATATRLALWATAQDLAQQKAWALLVALAAQAVAVILLGVAAIIVLA